MNLFTSKKYYSDNGVCSFHEFARELDEDYLRTQVNGGDCGGGAPSGTGGSGGSGSGGGTGHGTGGSSSSGATTTPQAPAVNPGAGETQNPGNQSNPGYTGGGGNYEPPKEVMSNPQAYAYWLSLQDKAMKEGDPGKYKDYNVLGYDQKRSERAKDKAYFIYTYSETTKDKENKKKERDSINDDIKYLESKGVSVTVIESGTKEDILKAFSDNKAKIIVTSGHGDSEGYLLTADAKRLYPKDLKQIQVGKSLNTVILESCYQGDHEITWETAFGGNIDVVGWKGETFPEESSRFNGNGFFDRQQYNLRDYLNSSLFTGDLLNEK